MIKALRNKVLVTNIDGGSKITSNGIIIPDDEGKERGIRPRWAEIYAVGSEVEDVKPGQWILISHGRWSRGVDIVTDTGKITVRQVDYPDAILLVSDSKP
jgi:co-chaperonin GroES (HSP10)